RPRLHRRLLLARGVSGATGTHSRDSPYDTGGDGESGTVRLRHSAGPAAGTANGQMPLCQGCNGIAPHRDGGGHFIGLEEGGRRAGAGPVAGGGSERRFSQPTVGEPGSVVNRKISSSRCFYRGVHTRRSPSGCFPADFLEPPAELLWDDGWHL